MRTEETYYHKILSPNGIGELPDGSDDQDAVNVRQLNDARDMQIPTPSNETFIII